jgi:hypothetical protein
VKKNRWIGTIKQKKNNEIIKIKFCDSQKATTESKSKRQLETIRRRKIL